MHRLLAKILDLPQAHIRVIAAPVGGGLRRQARPVRARDRRVQALPAHRPAGEVRADARGGLLRPSRPPPGADVDQDRLHEGRRDHRHALPLVARRRRVRLLRRRVDLLHRRAPDRDVQDSRVQVRRRARVHQQAALRAEARARHAAAALRDGVPDRQGGGAARPRPRGHAAAESGRAVHEDGEPPHRDDDRPRRVHRPRGRGVGLARQARPAAEREGHRHRVLVVSDRGRDRHLLERHAALGRRRSRRPQRARRGAVRRDGHRARLGFDPRVSRRRGARHRAEGHPRAPGGYGSHAGRSGLVLVARHADGGNAAIQAAQRLRERVFAAVAKKLDVAAGPPRRARSPRVRAGRRGARRLVRRGRRARRGDVRRARVPRLVRAAEARGQVQGRRRRPVALLLVLGVRRRGGRRPGHRPGDAHRGVGRARHRARAESAARRGPGRGLDLHGPRRGADGGAGVQEGRAQDPVDARVQEPDDPRDAGDPHDPGRDGRSRRARSARRRPGRGRSCRSFPRSRTRSTTRSACASTRSRSRPTRCVRALD